MDINEILTSNQPVGDIIGQLKQKSVLVPSWDALKKAYYPDLHEIVTDKKGRSDKVHEDGTVDKAARIHIGLEQLHVHRLSEFTAAIPIKRNYLNLDDEDKKRAALKQTVMRAIEAIYKVARIDTENLRRLTSYYASCEICTLWYTTKKPKNNLYGFPYDLKIKCRTLSPMDGVNLYPLFDETGDLIAMSFEYKRKVKDKEVTFFETYTSDSIYRWSNEDNGEMKGGLVTDEIPIGKIPCIYLWRPQPVYHGLSHIREDIEYTLSRNSDVVAYNSAPILHVAGGIKGEEHKGDSYRIFRTANGGNVNYVSWQQSVDALKYQVSTMFSLYWQQAQMPDISFENMKSLGNIGYDARMTFFMDAHLKVGDESGAIIEMLEREANVVKAYLIAMKPEWAEIIEELDIEHIITPYVQKDEAVTLNQLMKANGGKPVMSQLDSIRSFGKTNDAEATQKQIYEEQAAESMSSLQSVMAGGSAI